MSQKAGPPGSAGSGNPLDERHWSPNIESALSQHAAAVAHLNTINPALPKKFPGVGVVAAYEGISLSQGISVSQSGSVYLRRQAVGAGKNMGVNSQWYRTACNSKY
jgi:hypothetical protein